LGRRGHSDYAKIRINESKHSPKRQKYKKQINGKLNNIGSADENGYKMSL
jgi:hypothetical protein